MCFALKGKKTISWNTRATYACVTYRCVFAFILRAKRKRMKEEKEIKSGKAKAKKKKKQSKKKRIRQ